MTDLLAKALEMEERLNMVVKGQPESIRHLLCCFFAQGHALLEDSPGTGKTTLAKALASLVEGRFARIQFTPDLMPADISGTTIYNPKELCFDFHPGPVFCNVLLADEINRASPRTQSALLEAMEERQVSSEGKTSPLPKPFFVVATDNPVEMHGTYPLPEAQLDRFMCKLSLGYVNEDQEVGILLSKLSPAMERHSGPLMDCSQIEQLQSMAAAVHVSENLARYIVQIIRATRAHADVAMGSSARGGLALMRMAQARAMMEGRRHAIPADAQACAAITIAHRLILKESARYSNVSGGQIVRSIIEKTPAPV